MESSVVLSKQSIFFFWIINTKNYFMGMISLKKVHKYQSKKKKSYVDCVPEVIWRHAKVNEDHVHTKLERSFLGNCIFSMYLACRILKSDWNHKTHQLQYWTIPSGTSTAIARIKPTLLNYIKKYTLGQITKSRKFGIFFCPLPKTKGYLCAFLEHLKGSTLLK